MNRMLAICWMFFLSAFACTAQESRGVQWNSKFTTPNIIKMSGQLRDCRMGRLSIEVAVRNKGDIKRLIDFIRTLRLRRLPTDEEKEFFKEDVSLTTQTSLTIRCEYENASEQIDLIMHNILLFKGRAYEADGDVNDELVKYLKSIGVVVDDPTKYVIPQ